MEATSQTLSSRVVGTFSFVKQGFMDFFAFLYRGIVNIISLIPIWSKETPVAEVVENSNYLYSYPFCYIVYSLGILLGASLLVCTYTCIRKGTIKKNLIYCLFAYTAITVMYLGVGNFIPTYITYTLLAATVLATYLSMQFIEEK